MARRRDAGWLVSGDFGYGGKRETGGYDYGGDGWVGVVG